MEQFAITSGVPRRGLEPLPLAYGLRNKCVRMRQNMVFSTKNTKHFLGTDPSPDPSLSGEAIPPPRPHHLGACRTSTPPILKSFPNSCQLGKLTAVLQSPRNGLEQFLFPIHILSRLLYSPNPNQLAIPTQWTIRPFDEQYCIQHPRWCSVRLQAGVRPGRVHLCRVAGSTV